MTDLATRARRARLTIARTHVPEWFTTGLCIASILLGLVLIVEPDVSVASTEKMERQAMGRALQPAPH